MNFEGKFKQLNFCQHILRPFLSDEGGTIVLTRQYFEVESRNIIHSKIEIQRMFLQIISSQKWKLTCHTTTPHTKLHLMLYAVA